MRLYNTYISSTLSLIEYIGGLFYRKFFFDMIGGKLGPQGIMYVINFNIVCDSFYIILHRPNVKLNGLLTVIVKIPLLQILVLLLSAFIFLIVYPIKAFSIFTKNISFIITLLFLTGFLALGVYQVSYKLSTFEIF